jgi:5-methylcytosine-specific restriction endonuclease McrA
MEFDIVRGPRKVEDSVKQLVLPAPTEETYSVGVVDQFIGSDRPDTYEINGKVCRRDPKVRQAVMQRSNGACEQCGQKGFIAISGEYFLESHHVIPLSEGGPDLESNVMALCPAHHREAHFGMERDRLRELLLEGLAKMGY